MEILSCMKRAKDQDKNDIYISGKCSINFSLIDGKEFLEDVYWKDDLDRQCYFYLDRFKD